VGAHPKGLLTLATAVALLAATLGAGPSERTQLAPRLADVDAALTEAEQRLVRSEAIGVATGQVQNRFALRRDGKRRLKVCEDDELASLVTRSRTFGPAWRDAAQAARGAADRVIAMAERETVAPRLDSARRDRLERGEARAWEQAVAAAEAGAWHRRYVEGSFKSCGLHLTVADGMPVPGERTEREQAAPIAVIGLHFGTLCPDQVPANGEVALLAGPDACWAAGACDCEPVPVHPGAVLGPPGGLPPLDLEPRR